MLGFLSHPFDFTFDLYFFQFFAGHWLIKDYFIIYQRNLHLMWIFWCVLFTTIGLTIYPYLHNCLDYRILFYIGSSKEQCVMVHWNTCRLKFFFFLTVVTTVISNNVPPLPYKHWEKHLVPQLNSALPILFVPNSFLQLHKRCKTLGFHCCLL